MTDLDKILAARNSNRKSKFYIEPVSDADKLKAAKESGRVSQTLSGNRDEYGSGSDSGVGEETKSRPAAFSDDFGRDGAFASGRGIAGGGRWTAERLSDRHSEVSSELEASRASAIETIDRNEGAKKAHRQILDARAHNTSTAAWEQGVLQEAGFGSFEELKKYVDNPQSMDAIYQKENALEAERSSIAAKYYHAAGQGANASLSGGKNANLYQKAVQAAVNAQIVYDRYRYGGWDNTASVQYAKAVQNKAEAVNALISAGYDETEIERALEYAVRQSREKSTEKSEESLAQYAKENPVAASAISIGTGVAQGADYVGALVKGIGHSDTDNLETYRPISKADMPFTGMTNAMRGGVTERIAEDVDNETMEKVAIFAYQTGMSVADSMSLALTLGPAASVVMGSGAAANATRDAVERGGTNRQALTLGLTAGVAELMFERISIGNLLDDTKLVTNAKQWALETMKQAGVEASEEMATEVANIIADAAVMGRNSNSQRARERYLAQGMTPEQAERRVFLDNLESVGLAGLGGALSGGVSGGSFNAVNLAGEYAAENLLWRGVSQGAQEGQEQGSLKGVWGDGQKNTALFGSSKYTKEEADAIRHEGRTFINVIAGIDSTVSEFFKKWAGGRKSHLGEKLEKLYLGKMTDAVKSEVSDILGYDVDERDFIVTNDDVKHIIDEHGDSQKETGQKNNIPLDEWVFDALPEVVTNPDTIKKGHEGTGKNKGKTGVVFSKTFPNGRVVSVQYDNKGRGTLEIATIYAKESTTSVVNTPDGVNTFTSKTTEPVLSSNQRIAQEANGVNIVPEITSEDAERIKQAKHFGGKSGLVRDANLDKMNLSYRVSSTIDAIAKIAGVQVRVVEKAAGGSANGTYSEGVIELAMDSENPLMTVFTHELVHRIRETSPESYAAMAKFVQENVGGRAMKALANRYSKAYKTTDVSEWSEEMVADAFATVLQDSKVMSQFAQDNRTAFEKVRDVIRDMINAVKRVLNGQNVKMTGEQRAAFSRLSMQLQEMEKVMADAIKNLQAQSEMADEKIDTRDAETEGKKSLKADSASWKEAAKAAKQDVKDAQLAGMMNQGRKDAAKLRKAKETTAEVRRKRDEAIKELKQKQRDREAAMRESRDATSIRKKIQRHVNDMSAKLRNPTDKKHIPEELRGPVAKLLESINMESKDGAPTKRTQAFAELKKAYSEIAESMVVDPDLLSADGAVGLFDEVIAMADKRISEMSVDELETVWKTIRAVEASIRNANKTFAANRYKTVQEAAQALWNENVRKKDKGYRGIVGSLLDVDMLTPQAFFHRLGSAGDAMFQSMRAAQDKHIRLMKEVSDFTHENLNKKDTDKWEKELHTVTLGGQQVEMSSAQLMELYALMRRKQAMDHLLKGGILPDAIVKKGKKSAGSEAIRGLTADELMEATSKLTDEQVQVAELLQEYASSTLADFGNEASMEVYGYRKFGEEHYWPIRSNRAELKSDIQKDTQVTSVANRGFTKNVKPNAKNSVQIGSIFDTFASHASDMATYSAWLGTSEDVNRIRNFTYKAENDDGSLRTIGTVKGLLDRAFGTGKGQSYLQKLLSDIAIGVKGTNDPNAPLTSGLVGNYKAASIGANLRVVIQQPTAILRALEVLNPKYLASGVGLKRAMKAFETAKEYAPIAVWKDWGYFDIHTGRQMKDVLFETDTALDKVKEVSMWPAGKADSWAWGMLWLACESEVKDTTNLHPGTDEFYKKVAERFNEVIDKTQVVDGILQRSQIMRSGDNFMKMATSFMAEPTKQYNMFLSAIHDAKNTPEGKKRIARTSAALATSALLNVVAQSLVDAWRDDDREKKYLEKVLKAATGIGGDSDSGLKNFLGSNLFNAANPLGYIPFVKDAWSVINDYDVSRMDMDSIDRTVSSAKNLMKALQGKGKTATGNAVVSFIAESSRLIGVPLANVKRDIVGLALSAASGSDNRLLEYRIRKILYRVTENTGMFYDVLYDAMKTDAEAYRIIYWDMIKSGMTEEKIKDGMETRMKKAQGVKSVKDLTRRWEPPKGK
jgi:hypothetical protein